MSGTVLGTEDIMAKKKPKTNRLHFSEQSRNWSENKHTKY